MFEKILTTQPDSELKPDIEVRLIALGGGAK